MQSLEGWQRSLRPGLRHSDPFHALAGFLGSLAWRLALNMLQLAHLLLPTKFSASHITNQLRDARQGYSDVLKV
jgi:hypothetical protein